MIRSDSCCGMDRLKIGGGIPGGIFRHRKAIHCGYIERGLPALVELSVCIRELVPGNVRTSFEACNGGGDLHTSSKKIWKGGECGEQQQAKSRRSTEDQCLLLEAVKSHCEVGKVTDTKSTFSKGMVYTSAELEESAQASSGSRSPGRGILFGRLRIFFTASGFYRSSCREILVPAFDVLVDRSQPRLQFFSPWNFFQVDHWHRKNPPGPRLKFAPRLRPQKEVAQNGQNQEERYAFCLQSTGPRSNGFQVPLARPRTLLLVVRPSENFRSLFPTSEDSVSSRESTHASRATRRKRPNLRLPRPLSTIPRISNIFFMSL
jgi:hypothetical protein